MIAERDQAGQVKHRNLHKGKGSHLWVCRRGRIETAGAGTFSVGTREVRIMGSRGGEIGALLLRTTRVGYVGKRESALAGRGGLCYRGPWKPRRAAEVSSCRRLEAMEKTDVERERLGLRREG